MNIIDKNIPPYAGRILELLEDKGFEAWYVGGCVRDALLGTTAYDVDITTNALVGDVKKVMEDSGHPVIDTGIAHGTVTVLIEGQGIEVTTYRSEGAYSDNRHPDSVSFVTSLDEDLARRDFTMNAIAYHPTHGMVDPYGGYEDIKNGVIRCVGDPLQRFEEDALRILRACRFSSQGGFAIEDETFKAMKAMAPLLPGLSAQRLRSELDRFMCGSFVHDALMSCTDVIAAIIPEIEDLQGFDQRTKYHIYDVLEHTAYCMQHVAPNSLVRWAAFFHDFGKPYTFTLDKDGVGHFYGHEKISREIAEKYLSRFALGKSFTEDVLSLIRFHDETIEASPKAVMRMVRKLGERPELLRVLLELKRGDARAQAPHCHYRVKYADEVEAVLDEIVASQAVFSRRALAIDGHDILDLGIAPGPVIHELLEYAVEAVIDGRVVNDREALLALIQKKLEIRAT